jgi:hypothetical protein
VFSIFNEVFIMATFGPVGVLADKCATKSSALCSWTVGMIKNSWCEEKIDPLCENTNGVLYLKPEFLKWAEKISKKYNVGYNLVIGVILAYTGYRVYQWWQGLRGKNPNLSSEELMTKIIKEQFGKSAEIIIAALKDILAPLNDSFKAEVEKEQPYLKGNAVFEDLIKAGIEEKKEKLLAKFATLLITADNKKALEAQVSKSATPEQTGKAAAGGMQEGALTDGLTSALKTVLNAAEEALRVHLIVSPGFPSPITTMPVTTMPFPHIEEQPLAPDTMKLFSAKP